MDEGQRIKMMNIPGYKVIKNIGSTTEYRGVE